jgi:dephospho-CoA kinase
VLTVGLTGGIGAGKSLVAQRLRELGAIVIDSDALAREVVEPGTDGLAAVVAAFGARVLQADGSLDRQAVASIVFGDDARRRVLEAIIHPRVRERTARIVAQAPPQAVVVNDVPLLVEAGLAATFDLVVVVLASTQVRVDRLVRHRGMTAEQAHTRIAAQASDEQRRAVATVVITNEGSTAQVREEVDRVWRDDILPRLGRVPG